MPDITYRRSSAIDAEVVFDLVSASVRSLAPVPYSQDVVDTWMFGRVVQDYRQDCTNQAIWVAERDQRPIGFAHGVPGEIIRLFVDEDCVGMGVGAELMQLALQDALPNNAGKVTIEATVNAVPFYEKWGFETVGLGFFSGRDKDLPPIKIVNLEKVFQ